MYGNSISLSSDGNIIAIGDHTSYKHFEDGSFNRYQGLYKYLNGKMVHGHNLAVILLG